MLALSGSSQKAGKASGSELLQGSHSAEAVLPCSAMSTLPNPLLLSYCPSAACFPSNKDFCLEALVCVEVPLGNTSSQTPSASFMQVDVKKTALALSITDSELSDEEASILESGGFSVSRATTPQLTDVSEGR